ncbi:PaaI family thioesterase [Indiicoccus explosivorum]|uniref:PaaI family thioesterase n=1 Tax=Indiicoccus explosivorum TaxID=1917864 RepID=UPI000B434235|nr:PaaI family thioesterase [Indiicoccus explosivorum]
MFIKQPFDEFLGFEYERTGDGKVAVTLQVKPLHINSAGVVHGGVISTLADVALSNTMEPDGDGVQKSVTVDLNVTFLKGARSDRLTAFAEVIKAGKALTHADCRIEDESGTLIAKAKGVFFNR